MATRPIIHDSFLEIDALRRYEFYGVRGKNLKEGMVITDDDGYPVAGLDTKQTKVRNSGATGFLTHDLEGGNGPAIQVATFTDNRVFKVLAG